jgi:hypothetical protein
MPTIFVSYRRGMSSGWAGRLAETLRTHFGPTNVFMDIETIRPGVDFVEAISQAVESCNMLLAIIAPDWLQAETRSGERRLDDPQDFVRIELVSALSRGIRVIPVLVGGATMPTADDLPGVLQALARRQAHELSDTRWDYDCQRLIEVLGDNSTENLAAPRSGQARDTQSNSQSSKAPKSGLPRILLSGGAIVLIVIAGYAVWRLPSCTRSENVPVNFPYPMHDGFRLDVCLSPGVDCGKPAADEWCKRKSFSQAAEFAAENVGKRGIPTKIIGTGEVCSVEVCTSFTYIQCK